MVLDEIDSCITYTSNLVYLCRSLSEQEIELALVVKD